MKDLQMSYKRCLMILLVCLLSSQILAEDELIQLPEPDLDRKVPLVKTLSQRRSIRDFSREIVELPEMSQILWACQGISCTEGYRTAPSAGALYPLELFIFVERVSGLEPGIYQYKPGPGIRKHALLTRKHGDFLDDLADAALGQNCIRECAFCIVICSVTERTSVKYGSRSERYVYLEAGHAAQNACLQTTALNLGAVTVGAFYDDKVKDLLGITATPVYFLPVGRKSK